jgi:hypothetical protein
LPSTYTTFATITDNPIGTIKIKINAPNNEWVNYVGNTGPYGVPNGGTTCFSLKLNAFLYYYSTGIVLPKDSNSFKVCIEECKVKSFSPVTSTNSVTYSIFASQNWIT